MRGLFLLIFFEFCAAIASGDAAERSVRGVVADESAGVLPGVTVVATAADGRVLSTTVTDGAGRYAIGPLAAGTITLTFELEGFSPAAIRTALGTEVDVIVNRRLVLAPRNETVTVIGTVPAPRPLPPAASTRPPRPRPATLPVPEHDPDSVCGPARLEAPPESFGTIRSRREAANGLYARGDELLIDGGTLAGLILGHNYAVRRTFRVEWDPRNEVGEHTAGVVQIVSVSEQESAAVVIYACDEMRPGDRLASFTPEPLRPAEPAGTPDYKRAARILFPDIGQLLGAPRRAMVIGHGSLSGVRAGQRMTLFRRHAGEGTPAIVGDAVVVAVRTTSATIRVEHVTDPIFDGDWAAPQAAPGRRRERVRPPSERGEEGFTFVIR